MTLDTRIYAHEYIDAHEVFLFCRGLLGATDAHTFRDAEGLLSNDPGQGLPAWLMLYHGNGAPLRTAEQAAEHDEDICNLPGVAWYNAASGPCDGTGHLPASWLTVSFDTAYGYSDDRGYGCGDLHAEYVAKLGQWFDEHGVTWSWMNEFTGEIHTGFSRLVDLASGGFEASAWFRTSVLPAIQREVQQ